MAERGLLDLVQSMVGLVFVMHHVLHERYSRQREELIRCLLALSCVHPTFLPLLSTMLAEAILPAAVGERDARQSWVSKQQLAAQSTEDMPAHINCLQIVRTPSHDPQTTSTLIPISPEAMSFFTFREA